MIEGNKMPFVVLFTRVLTHTANYQHYTVLFQQLHDL